jgi:heme/copper-type cytochrome/quinol oxidase subunit 4
MKSLPMIKRQILIIFVFSLLISVASIIHGIFFDLDWGEIGRLTIQGFIFTLVVVFPGILFLEWVFDINNKKKLDEIERRLNKLEKRKKD